MTDTTNTTEGAATDSPATTEGAPASTSGPGSVPATNWDAMKLSDLRAAARERGLRTGGTAAELVARLRADDQDKDGESAAEKYTRDGDEPTADGAHIPAGTGARVHDADHQDPGGQEGPVEVEGTGYRTRVVLGADQDPSTLNLDALNRPNATREYTHRAPAVKPAAVTEAWLRKGERQTLRRAIEEGLVPCGEVTHHGPDAGGKTWTFTVPVRD
ncbi:hypothetical protein GCM10027160_23360 [Streptomyces calidiresistens]|uniref:SAP domain-containing protein n=1 Tax=Streptomyces calidiresistens TaxID=1485586 RepID=A0A7W3T6Q5_9ACTN|nr:SAP domain-containing protein [Streptomyces calidiresistens]MBB0231963.1 hypothetical protein [Streptomyces calidiresistens]